MVSYKADQPHVLLIVADSLMTEPLKTLMNDGKLPGFSFLRERGFMMALTSVFPTMSVVNDSSILTGTYPDEHHVPGLVWFDRRQNRMVNYGDSLGNIIRQGPWRVAEDALLHLNDSHLNPRVETIHEHLAKRNIPSASINLMVRRGRFGHPLRFPFGYVVGQKPLSGPSALNIGYFLKDGSPFPHPLNKYGYGNKEVEKHTRKLLMHPDAPRLIVTYLSEPDKVIHKKGPRAKQPLYDMDQLIQRLLDSFPNREAALKRWRIIVMGDSGQAPVLKDKSHSLISMPHLFPQFVLRGVRKNTKRADIAVATNERMAYLYPLNDSIDPSHLASRSVSDPRVDLAAYVKEGRVYVQTEAGRLHFGKGGARTDPYGQSWDVAGDPSLLDVKMTKDRWSYGSYKDVFRQLYGAVHAQVPPAIVLTAKSGYEFQFEASPTHAGGGSHGGISEQEMTVSLIVGGTTRRPVHDRIVDMKAYIIDCLELDGH